VLGLGSRAQRPTDPSAQPPRTRSDLTGDEPLLGRHSGTLAQTRPTTLVESRSSSLRRRPLSRARGNRDKPHLCAGFTLKYVEHCRFAFPAHALNGFDPSNPVLTSVGEPR